VLLGRVTGALEVSLLDLSIWGVVDEVACLVGVTSVVLDELFKRGDVLMSRS